MRFSGAGAKGIASCRPIPSGIFGLWATLVLMLQSKATLLISKLSQSAVRAKVNEDAWSWSRLNWLWGLGLGLGLEVRLGLGLWEVEDWSVGEGRERFGAY